MTTTYELTDLDKLEAEAVHIFREVAATIERPALLFSGGKDSVVMLHSLMDALLGAAGLGDIGQHFPDTDPAYKGADSAALLTRVMGDLTERGWQVVNVDVCLIGERPKIGPYHQRMQARVAQLLGLPPDGVNVKATTTEKLVFTGRGEGLAAQAVVLIRRS